MATVLTPDFYSYQWAPLDAATLDGAWVDVAWPDGKTLRCFALWLAENVAETGFEVKTRESIIDPSDLPPAASIQGVSVSDEGGLRIDWHDGTTSAVHPGWLRHVADERHLPGSYLPAQEPWTAASLGAPPTTDGCAVLDDKQLLRQWLNDMVRFGFARLRNTPVDPNFLGHLAAQIGPIRDTNFGAVWSVQAVLDPDSTANTGLNLGQHTDLPTRETPPGFQFLHCIENSVQGGWSRMTDGRSLVGELEANHPAVYEALTTLRWTFFNRSPGCDHRWTGPMIDLGSPDQPLTLRAFYPVRGFPAMPEKDVARAYESMRVFSRLAHDPRFQLRYPFAVGDLIGFDNRRMLHGRDSFDSQTGARHLRGTYIDQDDLFSTLRVLERDAEQESFT